MKRGVVLVLLILPIFFIGDPNAFNPLIATESDEFEPYWRIVTTDIAPSPRYGHMMAFNPDRNVSLLAGGATWIQLPGDHYDSLYHFNDTWEFDHNTLTWTELEPLPQPCVDGSLIYDSWTKQFFLFGGMDDEHAILDTILSFNGTWSLEPAKLPVAVYDAAVASNPYSGLTYISGGWGNMGPESSVLSFNGTAGTISDISRSIGPRIGHSMTYIPPYTKIIDGSLVSMGDILLVVGGKRDLEEPVVDGKYANVNSDGGIGEFVSFETGLPENAGEDTFGFFDSVSNSTLYFANNLGNANAPELWKMELTGPLGDFQSLDISLDAMPDRFYGGAMTYDGHRGFLLIFGGLSGGIPQIIFGDSIQYILREPSDRPQLSHPDDAVFLQGTGNSISWEVQDDNPSHYVIYDNGAVLEQNTWISGHLSINVKDFSAGNHHLRLWLNDTTGYENEDLVQITINPLDQPSQDNTTTSVSDQPSQDNTTTSELPDEPSPGNNTTSGASETPELTISLPLEQFPVFLALVILGLRPQKLKKMVDKR